MELCGQGLEAAGGGPVVGGVQHFYALDPLFYQLLEHRPHAAILQMRRRRDPAARADQVGHHADPGQLLGHEGGPTLPQESVEGVLQMARVRTGDEGGSSCSFKRSRFKSIFESSIGRGSVSVFS